MRSDLTVEVLVTAIRSAATLEELHRLVGPTESELADAKQRCNYLERIAESCNFTSTTPSYQESLSRDRWNTVMNEQSEFENKYF